MKRPCQSNFGIQADVYWVQTWNLLFLSLPFGGGLEGASKIRTDEEKRFYQVITSGGDGVGRFSEFIRNGEN